MPLQNNAPLPEERGKPLHHVFLIEFLRRWRRGNALVTLRSSRVPDITILGVSLSTFQRTSDNTLS